MELISREPGSSDTKDNKRLLHATVAKTMDNVEEIDNSQKYTTFQD